MRWRQAKKFAHWHRLGNLGAGHPAWKRQRGIEAFLSKGNRLDWIRWCRALRAWK